MNILDTSIHVLLIEDDMVDVLHIKYGFREYNIKNTLDVANNGIKALNKLYDKEAHLPKLIILDINIPKMNGFELLKKLKMHPQYKLIPVVMVTTSNAVQDRKAAADLNVAGYFIRPLKFEEFMPLYSKIVSV